jgi:hypothetical protein
VIDAQQQCIEGRENPVKRAGYFPFKGLVKDRVEMWGLAWIPLLPARMHVLSLEQLASSVMLLSF